MKSGQKKFPNPVLLDCPVFNLRLQVDIKTHTRRRKPKSLNRVGDRKTCLAMEILKQDQLEDIKGGLKFSTVSGMLCTAALLLACTAYLAPIAVAPGIGCAAFLAAQKYWESQGIVVE